MAGKPTAAQVSLLSQQLLEVSKLAPSRRRSRLARRALLAYAQAAAAASGLYADLTRRADRLLAEAPKLRSRDAIAVLLAEDAQPARSGKAASDRSAPCASSRAAGPSGFTDCNHGGGAKESPKREKAASRLGEGLDTELADLPQELRWREWMGRVEAVIFASPNPVRDWLANRRS